MSLKNKHNTMFTKNLSTTRQKSDLNTVKQSVKMGNDDTVVR